MPSLRLALAAGDASALTGRVLPASNALISEVLIMRQSTVNTSSFFVNPRLDVRQLARAYRENRRLHIPHFLSPRDADDLYRYLLAGVGWRTLLVVNGRRFGAPPGTDGTFTPDEEREIADFAHKGARDGFASFFEAIESSQETHSGSPQMPLLARFTEFLNSQAFLGFLYSVTGISELSRVNAQAVRFRPGHFIMFHEAIPQADETGKRRASYALDLTPEWRPEWGGMLEFRRSEGYSIEAVLPCFNALNVFAFPQGNWISSVAPFANGPRYSILGAIYAA